MADVETIELLRAMQLVAFVLLALVAVLIWIRHRSRPSAYLALAFGALAAGILVSRFAPETDGPGAGLGTALTLLTLLLFPWFAAAMSWSFEAPVPRWLRLALVPVVGLGLVAIVWDVLPAEDHGPTVWQGIYLGTFVALWALLSAAAAVRLFRSGGRESLIRARMRLMASGLLLLTLALLIAGAFAGRERSGVTLVSVVLSLLAAAVFVAGFAPPLLLRAWWRRRSGEEFQRMQAALIGAATPADVAQAIAPMLADLVGGSVAVIGRDGTVQAIAHVAQEQLAQDRARLLGGDQLDGDAQVIQVDAYWLVVRTTPYTPVFGQGERELVDGLAIQLRLALERAELFQAHLEARAAAEAASQELEATLMGLSHDLKSPTAAIAGFAELLAQSRSPTDQALIVEQIRASTSYLEELVDALLAYSKVGRTQVEVEPVDLAATVSSVARRLAVTDPGMTVVLDGELPVVLANPVRMEQVFDNLLGNAAKHGGREDLTVTVGAEPTSDGVRLLVRDDGQGLASDDAERIFTLFARGEGATRSGSGVGLGMVRRIIESYGGSVQALESERGATFEIVLPEDAVVDTRGRATWSDTNGTVAGRSATT